MNLNLKILQNIIILAFGVPSLMHASSSSSSSIAQRLVQAAAVRGASIGQQRVAAPSVDNKAQQEDAHNPASAQSSSAGAIAEAPMLAMRTSSLASSSSSSANGLTFSAQAGVPALTAAAENDSVRKQNAVRRNAKQVRKKKPPKLDEASLASYSEAAAEKKYKECKEQAAKFYVIRQGRDNEQGSKKANDCLCTICNHTGSLISTMVEHIAHTHLLEPLFACLKCGGLSISKTIRNSHAMRCKGLQSSKKSTSLNSSSTSSNNSSSGGSMQPAQADVSAMSTNKGTTEHEDCIMHKKYINDAAKYCQKNGKDFICKYPQCKKELRSKAAMNRHIIVEHLLDGALPFKCQTCGKGYNTKKQKLYHNLRRCADNTIQSSQLKESATEQESSSSSNSSSSGSMQPAKANAIAPNALFTSADNKAQQENEHNPASAQSSSARAIAEVHALTMRASSLSSSNNSSSGGFMQPAGAFAPAVGENNGATASLLPAEPVEMQTARQAQSNGKRKDSSPHKQPSSKKQKIDQEAIEKPAQNFPSSSSSSSSSNYAQAPMPSTDGLSSASATASTALLAGYASQHTSPQQELEALALLLGTSLPDSNSSTSAQAGALPTDSNESVAPAKDTVDDFDIGKFLQSDY